MKTTEIFKNIIQSYLIAKADSDEMFAKNIYKKNKSIDGCIIYILNEVQRSGCNGFTDEEIYGMAIHYMTKDNIETGKAVDCRVVVNHIVELTEEEKAEARRQSMKRLQEETYVQMKIQQQKRVSTEINVKQNTLF